MSQIKGNVKNTESLFFKLLRSGDSFFTEKPDKDMTAAAVYYGVKITTERFILIHPITLETKRVVKVTIL